MELLLFFWSVFKASLFSSGGLANIPAMRQDTRNHGWASDADLANALIVGQLSPGFNGIWVVALGFFAFGLPGSIMAFAAILLPPILILAVEKGYLTLRRFRAVEGGMRGLTCVVLASTMTTMVILGQRMSFDWRALLIGTLVLGLSFIKRIPIVLLAVISGVLGYFLYS